ncbi:MAG: glycoside hydrolase family 31 protein [Armatimonadota bacterium]
MNTNQTILLPDLRFQVLSPSLIRMEYSAKGKFTDASTVSVLNRCNWPDVEVDIFEIDGWFTISTPHMNLRFRLDSGPFDTDNLEISWDCNGIKHTWHPGDTDDQNLGGLPPTMDNIAELPVVPGALSRKGCFLLDDSKSPIRDLDTQWIIPRDDNQSIDWYFFAYGNDYQHMLHQLSHLLGPIPMIPRYVLGAWFTSRAAYSQNQWQMIAERFRDESLPLDILVLDSCSWTNVIWSGYDWDFEQIPDPEGFLRWTKDRGFNVSMNEHYAALTPESDHNFDTIRREMGLPDDTAEIAHDLADKKYANLFMDLLHKPALDMGLAFWWQDGWAPANMDGLDPAMWTREIEYIGSEQITGKRAFIFCRLGSAWGTHRYGSYFTGDMFSNWPTLAMNVDAAIKGGNILAAWVNHDVGAIFGVKIDDELYLRWMQFGAFSPICRFHSLWGMRLPWEYGDAGIDCYRKFIGLRYSLIPYMYTYSRIAHKTGLPLVSGMYIHYPNQENSYNYPLQFMFGREILIAPITEPGEGKPVTKDIFLPEGESWFDFFKGDVYKGGLVISYACPLDQMPVFVRAGSIIPMAPPMDFSDEKPVDPLTLDIYAGKPAEFNLYEDDGISLDYRNGNHSSTHISFGHNDLSGDYTIKIGAADGKYDGQPENRRYSIKLHGLLKPESITHNGNVLAQMQDDCSGTGWKWDKQSKVLTIKLSDPLSVYASNDLLIKNAGTFEDYMVQQKALDLLDRVRRVKIEEKIKYAALLGGRDHSKPPRVIRITEQIEQQLIDIVSNPKGSGDNIPDFDGMTKVVINSFTDQPFESNRTIPDINESSRSAGEAITDCTFTQDELEIMCDIMNSVKA